MGHLEDRWDRRQDSYRDGREPFTAQGAVMIAAQPQTVWDFLHSPGTGVLLDHRFIKRFPVPGTPAEGVGHQYCTFSMGDQGALAVTVSEVVEYDPPRRYLRKIINADVPILEAHTIAEVPGGCSYAVSFGLRIPSGTSRSVGLEIQRDLEEHAAKVKAFVESGAKG